MTRPATAALVLILAAAPRAARAQSVTAEVDVLAGRSTEDVNAAAIQIRLFGATKSDWRFYAEAVWGLTSGGDSDAFGAAYPYDKRVRAMEAFTEKTLHPGGWIVGVRAGRYRTPFGMYGRGDHAYTGFTRAPLIRYGENWALSNNLLEGGAAVLVGRPALALEASVGVPQDENSERRRPGAGVVLRAQGYLRSLIVGASTMRSRPSDPRRFVKGRMIFHGVDARWMRSGVQLRGEWIVGRPFDGVATRGGYLDTLIHPRWLGPVTAVARIERLDYDADEFSEYLRRFTAGARVRFTPVIGAQINLVRELGRSPHEHKTALDLSLTYSVRF